MVDPLIESPFTMPGSEENLTWNRDFNADNKAQDIGFTVALKNLSFTLLLSGYFFNRCGIKSLHPVP